MDARKRWSETTIRIRRRPRERNALSAPALHGLARAFGNLRVRPKLMVLHNLFFLILAAAAYFALDPLFNRQVYDARARELSLVRQAFFSGEGAGAMRWLPEYEFRRGSAADLQVPAAAQAWLDGHPGAVWSDVKRSVFLFQKDAATGRYKRVRAATTPYADVVAHARATLFLVLGAIYIAAVLVLETLIMPRYVYGPLRLMLVADKATHEGDRERELIPEEFIMGDEVGQIMRSRNATIAELREHEDNLAAALRKLEEQDRLASLGLLSASVAHELNTPLTVLHGSIEKLKEITDDAHTLERLSRMERVTLRLRRISERLVDFARQRRERMEPHDLRPIVEESWQLVAIDERASGVSFRNEVEPAQVVNGNPDRLVQVFVNLLRNALYAVQSSDGRSVGEIAVRSRPIAANGRRWLSVTVEDNGPGIPADVLPDIFEAFVTTRLDAQGTGLGLAVSEGIVTQHGGTIAASNSKDGGACIEVRFPSILEPARPAARTRESNA